MGFSKKASRAPLWICMTTEPRLFTLFWAVGAWQFDERYRPPPYRNTYVETLASDFRGFTEFRRPTMNHRLRILIINERKWTYTLAKQAS